MPAVLDTRRRAPPEPARSRPVVMPPKHMRLAAVEQMARLIRSGVAPSQAASQIATNAHRKLSLTLKALATNVEAGGGFAEAAASSGLLDAAEAGLLAVGERTGRMPDVLARIAVGWRRGLAAKRQLLMAAVYPLMLLSLSVLTLPLPALVSRGVGAYLRECASGFAWIAGAVALVACVPWAIRRLRAGPLLRRVAWHLPGLGVFYRKKVLSDALHGLATGLDAGLGVQEALRLASAATADPTISEAIGATGRAIDRGEEFAVAVRATGLLPAASLTSIAGGETSGTLAESLAGLADDYAHDFADMLTVAVRVGGVLLLVAVTAIVAMRILGTATGLQMGGSIPPELQRELDRSVKYLPLK